jgi:D-glycerate 3-kinase
MFNHTLSEFINENKLSRSFEASAIKYFIPLAEHLSMHQYGALKPLFVGINGSQGSGKSTLADFIKTYLQQEYSLNVVTLSLDDFYYSKAKRAELAKTIHPLLATRGAPGTHDLKHIHNVLEQLVYNKQNIKLPRFNKATDNPFPSELWPTTAIPVNIVLFEGWCWGVSAQSEAELETPVNPFEQTHDTQGLWRKYVNQQLKIGYEPLYRYFDTWIMLKAPAFGDVYQWRLEQEHKLRANTTKSHDNNIMSAAQIKDFIQFYQRLTEHSLTTSPPEFNHVFELDAHRKITAYTKKSHHE